jgi:DNA invertase Pin-like site-specific DNA recombinase
MLGIYCRISKEKDQGKDRSIDDQRLSGIELANQLCINYEVYIDEGLSGTLPIEHRPSLSKLIDDIYDGKISCVYVYDQSRLERSPEARFVLNKVFKDEKIKLYTDNGLIGTDIESEFQGDLLSIINNFYVKLTAKKVRSALRRNLANGKVHAITPYGYKKDNNNVMVVDEIQAVIVKRIYTLSWF